MYVTLTMEAAARHQLQPPAGYCRPDKNGQILLLLLINAHEQGCTLLFRLLCSEW
jgi:hypothetical protein